MFFSIPLLVLLAQSAAGVPISVLDRDVPASLDLEATSTIPATTEYDWTSGYVSEFPVCYPTW